MSRGHALPTVRQKVTIEGHDDWLKASRSA